MMHLRKLLLGVTTAVVALAFAVPAGANAQNPKWSDSGYFWGYNPSMLIFNGANGFKLFAQGVEPYEEHEANESTGALLEMNFPNNASTNLDGCYATDVETNLDASYWPTTLSYDGWIGGPILHTTKNIAIDFTMSEGCVKYFGPKGPKVIQVTGTVTAGLTSEPNQVTLNYSNASGLMMSGTKATLSGILVYEGTEAA